MALKIRVLQLESMFVKVLLDIPSFANNFEFVSRYCGTTTPPILTSSQNSITIVFKSDESAAAEGFQISYNFIDGSTSKQNIHFMLWYLKAG